MTKMVTILIYSVYQVSGGSSDLFETIQFYHLEPHDMSVLVDCISMNSPTCTPINPRCCFCVKQGFDVP